MSDTHAAAFVNGFKSGFHAAIKTVKDSKAMLSMPHLTKEDIFNAIVDGLEEAEKLDIDTHFAKLEEMNKRIVVEGD